MYEARDSFFFFLFLLSLLLLLLLSRYILYK